MTHPFELWLERTYGTRTPQSRDASLAAWNAAVLAASENVAERRRPFIKQGDYTTAAAVRDASLLLAEELYYGTLPKPDLSSFRDIPAD